MLEVADIVRLAGPAYRQVNATRLSRPQRAVMRDIEECRTAALGGHLEQCDGCEAKRYSYHSCRNRHCPKCHGERTRAWLERQRARLLSVPYYLITFTLPAELRPLARTHPREVYGALITAAAAALRTLTADPKFLGGTPGMVAVLHTWTRAMLYHPHVHFLVTAGGITADGQKWVEPRNPRFLVPGYVLGVVFRAKVHHALDKVGLVAGLPSSMWTGAKKWVVHVQHAGTGARVLDYLARYLFRIAIANSRLERVENGLVTFRWRDNRTGETRRCTLSAESFLDRFLLHVLPPSFTKVRYYGVFSPSRQHDLDRVAARLRPPTPELPSAPPAVPQSPACVQQVPPPSQRCPVCHIGTIRTVETLPRIRAREPP